jgi:hypothetical protein
MGWDTTGLAAPLHKPLSRRIGALLSQADRLRHMTADACQGLVPPGASAVQALLTGAIGCEPDVQPMLITLLMARIPECGPVLLRVAAILGSRGAALLRKAGEQAADTLLDQLEAPGGAEAHLGGHNLTEAGVEVRRLTALLGALDGEALTPERRSRLKDIRQRISPLSLNSAHLVHRKIPSNHVRNDHRLGQSFRCDGGRAPRLRQIVPVCPAGAFDHAQIQQPPQLP